MTDSMSAARSVQGNLRLLIDVTKKLSKPTGTLWKGHRRKSEELKWCKMGQFKYLKVLMPAVHRNILSIFFELCIYNHTKPKLQTKLPQLYLEIMVVPIHCYENYKIIRKKQLFCLYCLNKIHITIQKVHNKDFFFIDDSQLINEEERCSIQNYKFAISNE